MTRASSRASDTPARQGQDTHLGPGEVARQPGQLHRMRSGLGPTGLGRALVGGGKVQTPHLGDKVLLGEPVGEVLPDLPPNLLPVRGAPAAPQAC